jgi:putative transcriptional regulator
LADISRQGSAGQPLDALLAAYAAGSLSAPLHALVAAHLSIKSDNRAFVRRLEHLGARAVEQGAPVKILNRDARLAAIFDSPAGIEAPRHSACDILPAPLARFVGQDLNAIHWRTRLPGIKEFHVADESGGEASLLWIKPGRTVPCHTHDGSEVTIVLKGGFTDITGHYTRGDIAVADAELDHRPRADDGEDCICFAVTDAPLRLTGPFGRIVQRIFGH